MAESYEQVRLAEKRPTQADLHAKLIKSDFVESK
jgi:hypothetical protein